MDVRAKFRVISKTETHSTPENAFKVELVPVTSGSKENDEFFKYTPGGKIELMTINASAAAEFDVGKEYYVDFTLAVAATASE